MRRPGARSGCFVLVAAFIVALLVPVRVLASGDHTHAGDQHHEPHPHQDDHGLAPDHDSHGHDDAHGQHDHSRVFTLTEFESHGVELATAGPGVVDTGIELPAEVRPNADRLVHVAPRYPGIVREVRKHVGDHVRAGDVLAIIESENLSTYELKVALDGTVIDKHITPGEAVSRERPAYIVADLTTVWVHVAVYQQALPSVRVGQSVTIATRDGTLEAQGTLSYLAPVVDQATRTATARVVLENPDGRWRPGLFVDATVALSVNAAVVVPRRALHTMDGETVVFVAEDGTLVARPVTVGAVGRTRAQVLAGLSAGERFADEGSFLVKAELGKGAAGHDH